MDLFNAAERMMGMDDEAWARHANPWSVLTRFSVLPLIVLAIWSRVWIGWWCLVPIAAALWWNWWNPRAFGPPGSTDNWMSKGVFGERVFLNRAKVPIPAHHERAGKTLAALSVPGALALIYGLIMLDPEWTIFGMFAAVLPKVWFVDRMVWLYQDMKEADPRYREWSRR
ncbi:MAG: DUF6653 family protein [Pseudomonadota bacterium]